MSIMATKYKTPFACMQAEVVQSTRATGCTPKIPVKDATTFDDSHTGEFYTILLCIWNPAYKIPRI